MTWADAGPGVEVDAAEYVRLLGFPRGHELDGRALELAEWARQWYAAHGRPWMWARECEALELHADAAAVNGIRFSSNRLLHLLEKAGAHSVVVAAVSAGPEVEQAAQAAWHEERPDEYFFLETFGSAVVERLTSMVGARVCEWAEGEAMAVIPHVSPGYPGWTVADQPALFSLLDRDLPGPLEVFESGMLRPKKSLLAVFGITRHADRVRPLSGLVPCTSCSFAPCQFRRAPYRHAPFPGLVVKP